MTRHTLLPVAIQGDPFASRTDYVMDVSSPIGPSPIVPTRARVRLREYTLMTPAGCITWRCPESIEIMEHGEPPAVYGFDLVMTPPVPTGELGRAPAGLRDDPEAWAVRYLIGLGYDVVPPGRKP